MDFQALHSSSSLSLSHLVLPLGGLDAAEEHLAAAVPAALVRPPNLAAREEGRRSDIQFVSECQGRIE